MAEQVHNIIQITDSHLFGPDDGKLLGMETLHSLKCVLEQIKAEQPALDRFLCTGDLSQDGSMDSYQKLEALVNEFGVPQHWLPGNHDHQQNMARSISHTEIIDPIVDLGNWLIVMLDSQVEGSVHGNLAESQFTRLETALANHPNKHTLISFHHQPVKIGAKWLDNHCIRNGDRLIELVEKHPQVKCLLWGHIHQEQDFSRNGIRYLSTPSTCVQFTPESEGFSVDSEAPGYRWLELRPDGSVNTGVNRVENIEFEIDYSIKGY